MSAASTKSGECATLAEVLTARFGPTAYSQIIPLATKIFLRPPVALDASVFWSAPFRRLALLPDDIGAFLKRLPEPDERLAISSVADPHRSTCERAGRHPFRNFYPAARGMRGFCDQSEKRLGEFGVDMRLSAPLAALEPQADGVAVRFAEGEAEKYDRVIWTGETGALAKPLFGSDPLAELSPPVPMVLHYFVAHMKALGPYTYVQDFTPDHLLFRVCNAGRYGRQIRRDGTTYLCAEVPTARDGPVWTKPEDFARQLWRERVDAGAVTGDGWEELTTVEAPVSFRAGRIRVCENVRPAHHRLRDRPRTRANDLRRTERRSLRRPGDRAFLRGKRTADVVRRLQRSCARLIRPLGARRRLDHIRWLVSAKKSG